MFSTVFEIVLELVASYLVTYYPNILEQIVSLSIDNKCKHPFASAQGKLSPYMKDLHNLKIQVNCVNSYFLIELKKYFLQKQSWTSSSTLKPRCDTAIAKK